MLRSVYFKRWHKNRLKKNGKENDRVSAGDIYYSILKFIDSTLKTLYLLVPILLIIIFVKTEIFKPSIEIGSFGKIAEMNTLKLTPDELRSGIESRLSEVMLGNREHNEWYEVGKKISEKTDPLTINIGFFSGDIRSLFHFFRSSFGSIQKHHVVEGQILAKANGMMCKVSLNGKCRYYNIYGTSSDDLNRLLNEICFDLLMDINDSVLFEYVFSSKWFGDPYDKNNEDCIAKLLNEKCNRSNADYLMPSCLLGVFYTHKKEYDKAIKIFKTLRHKAKRLAPIYFYWGNALKGRGNYDEAIDKYKKVLDIVVDKNNSYLRDSYINSGMCYLKLKKYQEAGENFNEARYLKDDARINSRIGYAYSKLNDNAAAKYFCKIAIKKDPKLAYPNAAMGTMHFKSGEFESAIDEYKKSIIKNEALHFVWNGLGTAYNAIGNYEKSIWQFEVATTKKQGYVDAYNGWGDGLCGLHKFDDAIEKYCRAMEIVNRGVGCKTDKTNEDYLVESISLSGLGNVFISRGEYDLAAYYYERAIELNPHNICAYCGLGNIYLLKDNEEKAWVEFKEAMLLQGKIEKNIQAYHGNGNQLVEKVLLRADANSLERIYLKIKESVCKGNIIIDDEKRKRIVLGFNNAINYNAIRCNACLWVFDSYKEGKKDPQYANAFPLLVP